MKKYLAPLSVGLNIVLIVVVLFLYNSLLSTAYNGDYIGTMRLSDVQKLESMLQGRISKKDAIYLLKKNFPEEPVFDMRKDYDGNPVNLIDAGSMVLLFDNQNKLLKIEPSLFDGP